MYFFFFFFFLVCVYICMCVFNLDTSELCSSLVIVKPREAYRTVYIRFKGISFSDCFFFTI